MILKVDYADGNTKATKYYFHKQDVPRTVPYYRSFYSNKRLFLKTVTQISQEEYCRVEGGE